MSLTQQEKEKWQEVIKRTGGNRETAQKERIIPEEYINWKNFVDREEVVVSSPTTGIPVRCCISRAKERKNQCPLYVNMHGGGFVHPQDGDDDMYCAHVAAEINGIVVDIDYAVSYDHAFPVAFEQCYDVLKWACDQCEKWNVDKKKISIGGSSAGGNLAAAIALRVAATEEIKLSLVVLDYAAIDLYMSVVSDSAERSKAFSMLYSDGDVRMLQSPFCSPVFATDSMLKNHPRTLIITAQNCPFKPINEEYGRRLAACGTEVTMRCFTHSNHGFTIRLTGEWQQSQALIIRHIKEASVREG